MEREAAWVVVPAFNEGEVIGETIRSVLGQFSNIVVVDDCSSDNTRSIALAAGAHVCSHPINLGQGAALATGIRYARLQDAKAIVTFDADGQHDINDVMDMVKLLVPGQCEIVLGSRFLGTTKNMSARKRLFLKLATFYTRLTTGLAVTDTHNGLRALSAVAADSIRIRQNRMAHASEILDEIARLGLPYKETACTITYTDYSVAKGQRMSGAFAILADLTLRKFYK
jgi:glycosyltransferase involved in cell wall biosynthesis